MIKEPLRLDIGCGNNRRPGWTGVDCVRLPKVDICFDLTEFPWPFESGCASAIHLGNVIEHLPDTVATMNELHRIAAPNAVISIFYPYYRAKGAYGDPTHVHYFNEYMIDYFLVPGSTNSRENRFSFYTQGYWNLLSRQLITYPFLRWLPQDVLRFVSRHSGLDIVHGVKLEIRPEK